MVLEEWIVEVPTNYRLLSWRTKRGREDDLERGKVRRGAKGVRARIMDFSAGRGAGGERRRAEWQEVVARAGEVVSSAVPLWGCSARNSRANGGHDLKRTRLFEYEMTPV